MASNGVDWANTTIGHPPPKLAWPKPSQGAPPKVWDIPQLWSIAPPGQNDPVGDPTIDLWKWITGVYPQTFRQDPKTQGGFEYLVQQARDGFFNSPRMARESFEKFPGAVTDWAKPVVKNTVDWATMTEAEYRAQKDAAAAKSRALQFPVGKAPLSPTGEFKAGNPFMELVVARESSGNPNAKNPLSSATGPHQFIEQTWLEKVKTHGAKYGLQDFATLIQRDRSGRYVVSDPAVRTKILQLRTDPNISTAMANEHAKELQAGMSARLGRAPTNEELYLGWVFGAGPGALIATAAPENTAGAYVSAEAIKANPGLFPNGARTTVAQLRARMSRTPSGGTPSAAPTVLASQTTALPGAPPSMPQIQPVDFTRAEDIWASLKPEGVDQDALNNQKRTLLLSGLASGISSTEGGIPGMLARMASGGFSAQAAGAEYERGLQREAAQDFRSWQGKGLDLELTKAEQRAREGNQNLEVGYRNQKSVYDYKLALANLSKLDFSPSGFLEVQTVAPDGRSMQNTVMDVGAQIVAARGALAGGNSMFGGSSDDSMAGFPTSVKDAVKMYRWARQRSASGAPGGDAVFFGALADEIAKSPYKTDILGGDPKKYQSEVMKLAAQSGGDTDAAEINYITSLLAQAARNDPNGLQALMRRGAGLGLVGPLMMEQ